MLLGAMQQQEGAPGAGMLVVPTVKTRATDFSIAAIMGRAAAAGVRTEGSRRPPATPSPTQSGKHSPSKSIFALCMTKLL